MKRITKHFQSQTVRIITRVLAVGAAVVCHLVTKPDWHFGFGGINFATLVILAFVFLPDVLKMLPSIVAAWRGNKVGE